MPSAKKSTSFSNLYLLSGLSILLVFCIIIFKIVSYNTYTTPKQPSISVLLFTSSESNAPGSPTIQNITDTNGVIIKSFYTTQTDSTYEMSITNLNGYISYSKGLLASDEIYSTGKPVSVTQWSLIKSNGSILHLSPIMLNILKKLSYIFVAPGNTIVALVRPQPDRSTPFRYSRFDLSTGKETTLLTISPANSLYFPHFIPEEINQSGDTISFLVSDITINSQTVQGTGIVLYNLSTNSIIHKTLPPALLSLIQTGQSMQYAASVGSIGVSSDGNWLVYQSPSTVTSNTGSNIQKWTTHIYTIPFQKDILVPTKITLPNGYNSYYFSPDNKYVVFYFENAMDIARVSDGKLVQSFTLGGDPNNPNPSEYLFSIKPIGWIDNQTLAYITQKSVSQGSNNFSGNSTSHAVNVVTHQIMDYPQSLGSLTAIIYKE